MDPYETFPTYRATKNCLDDLNPDALLADGLEFACIGWTEVWVHQQTGGVERLPIAVYSKNKVIAILMEETNMTLEDALEYAEYNIYAAYMGPNTPIFIDDSFQTIPTQPVLPEEMYEL